MTEDTAYSDYENCSQLGLMQRAVLTALRRADGGWVSMGTLSEQVGGNPRQAVGTLESRGLVRTEFRKFTARNGRFVSGKFACLLPLVAVDPTWGQERYDELKKRLLDMTDTSPGSGPSGDCWEWRGKNLVRGYGQVSFYGKTDYAHRWMYIAVHGSIPDGKDVCHTCDNPPCIRLDHLWAGTHAENMADRGRKGRQRALKGTERSNARLTEEQVLLIKADTRPQREIAKSYGVSHGLIGNIKVGRSWKHV